MTLVISQKLQIKLGYCNAILFQISVREEMKQLTAHSEKIDVELREYYQEQMEVVVRDKLQEFQEQLDAVQTSFQKEMEQRDHELNEVASQQLQQIAET
jgi:GTPase involved in cell partitioning and DNA repair